MTEEKILVTDLINQVSNQALTQESMGAFIDWVFQKAPLAIEHDASAILLKQGETPVCFLHKTQPVSGSFMADFLHTSIDAFNFETKSSFTQEQIAFVAPEDLDTPDGVTSCAGGLASFYATPLVVRKKVIGVIAISSTKPDSFLVYKLNMFNVFAGQLALGIDSLHAREQVISQARIIERDSLTMKNAFSGMSEGLIMADEQDKVVLINPAAARMLGWQGSNVGKTIAEINDAGLSGLARELSVSDRKFVSKELDTALPVRMTLRMDATMVRDSENRKIGILVMLRDVTREKEIDRMKTEFISIVSHELRTPLTTIRESVSQVLDGILGETTDEQKEFLSICLEDIDRLTRIINDLLDISKIEAKKVELKKSCLDLVALVRSVNLFFYPRAREKGLDLETSAPAGECELYVDRDKMIQVFNNLVGNALKFTSAGHIELSISDQGTHIECAVIDTGRGIAQEDLPKVFNKFEQFGRTDGPGEKGTGLGLAIAKGIVELHGGRMWVESVAERGTAFKFTLPKFFGREEIYTIITRKIAESKLELKEFAVINGKIENYQEIISQYSAQTAYSVLIRALDACKKLVGGQDFMTQDGQLFIIADLSRQAAEAALERMRSSLSGAAPTVSQQQVPITCSFEYDSYPEDISNIDTHL